MPDRASACPLADLCLEAEALARRRRGIEAQSLASEDGRMRRAADRAVDEIAVTLGHIAQRASDFRPQTRAGALFALACAAGEAEALEVADAPPPGALRRLRRHLWGLRFYLEREGALPEALSEFFMPRHRDPHAALAHEPDARARSRDVA